MSLETVTERIRQKLSFAPQINATVKFDFGDEGVVHVDATKNPAVISHDDAEAVTTLACSVETFTKIMDGQQDPNIAFMMGKLKVRGSMGVAMKLNAILEG